MSNIFVPTSTRYGSVPVLELVASDQPVGTLIVFNGGVSLRYEKYAVYSKGYNAFTSQEIFAVAHFLDLGYRVLVFQFGQIYRFGERWVSDICSWASKRFGEPVFLIGHSAGAVLALGHVQTPFSFKYLTKSVRNILVMSLPFVLPVKFKADFHIDYMWGEHDFAGEASYQTYCKSPNATMQIIPYADHSLWNYSETLKAIDAIIQEE